MNARKKPDRKRSIEVGGVVAHNVDKAADILNLTPRTIRQFIADKKLRAKKIGREWYILEETLTKYVRNGHNGD